MKKPKRQHPTDEKREYVTISGSGPSVRDFKGRVDVATKKFSVPADYLCARHQAWYYKKRHEDFTGFMLYKAHATPNNKYPVETIPNRWMADWKYWDSYFLSFNPKNQNKKPSVGLCTVFCVVERWKPDKIGLIGFDNVLDGHRNWLHDSNTEKRCIESLATIIDLRSSAGA